MATIGRLVVSLAANSAALVQELGKARQNVASFADAARKRLNDMGLSFDNIAKQAKRMGLAIGAAASAAVGALTLIVNRQRQVIDSSSKLAQSLGGTVEGMDALARAGGRAGVTTGELTAASQRLNQALGEAMLRGGRAKETLDRLGLSAEDLSKMDVDQRFAAIANRMRDMNLSTQQAASELRSLGIRQSSVIVLMQQGGQAIEDSRKKLEAYGVTISDIDATQVENMNDALDELGIISSGVGKRLTVELAPIVTRVAEEFALLVEEAGGVGDAVSKSVDIALTSVGFLVDAGDGVRRVFTIIANTIVGMIATAQKHTLGMVRNILEGLDKIPGTDLGLDIESLTSSIRTAESVAQQAADAINESLNAPLAGGQFLKMAQEAREAARIAAESNVADRNQRRNDAVFDGLDDTNDKVAKSASGAWEKIFGSEKEKTKREYIPESFAESARKYAMAMQTGNMKTMEVAARDMQRLIESSRGNGVDFSGRNAREGDTMGMIEVMNRLLDETPQVEVVDKLMDVEAIISSKMDDLISNNGDLFATSHGYYDRLVEELSNRDEVSVTLDLRTDMGNLVGKVIGSREYVESVKTLAAQAINNTARGVAA